MVTVFVIPISEEFTTGQSQHPTVTEILTIDVKLTSHTHTLVFTTTLHMLGWLFCDARPAVHQPQAQYVGGLRQN